MTAATKVAQDPRLIARLQTEASRSPGFYRFRLALIAIAGDCALMATQIIPIAAPIAIGALWVNVTWLYWVSGAGILLFIWIARPSFRFDGRELTPTEAPRLHEEIASLKLKLRVPGRMKVYLDESFNASAAETRGLFGLFGTQSALTLGVPLLVALNREQVLAVVAHEFGHFSRRHGRLGNWLYRARVGWIQYAEQISESDGSFDRAAAWYAERFVPFFSARSFVHSRQCEYEADSDAALAFGSKSAAAALTRVAVISRLWEERLPREIATWQLQNRKPPADFHARFAALVRQCTSAEAQAWVEEALRASSSWLDTHPSLSERLASLGETAQFASSVNSAGEELIGESWLRVVAEFDAKWQGSVGPAWLLEHLRLKHIAQPLLSADAATVTTWGADQQLARAKALRAIDPPGGLAALRELGARHPTHSRITFAYAAALLRENDETGVSLMESVAREHPVFRVQGFRRVLDFYERKGDSMQIERWSAWLKHAAQAVGEAMPAFIERVEAGEAQPTSLSASERSVIAEAAELDPCVRQSWTFEGSVEVRFTEGRPTVPIKAHLLALAIDPEQAASHNDDEEGVARRYEELLGILLPPDQFGVVRTYFTTEKMPAVYL